MKIVSKKDGKPIASANNYIEKLLMKGVEGAKDKIYREIFNEIFRPKNAGTV